MFLTIFTPTYNRAKLLLRLYESLRSQTCQDFEWLIVDDGSTDTTEEVVANIIKDTEISIRYLKKENGGKHTAHNLAIKEARGEYFFCVDSDDWLSNNAVADIYRAAQKVSLNDYAIVGGKILADGTRLSAPLSLQTPHVSFFEQFTQGARGEYSIIMKTKVIQEYPFPEIQGERFSTECILYDKMDLNGYTVCPCNEALTICEYQEGGLTSNIYQCLRENPTAYQIYHAQRIDLVKSIRIRFRHATKYWAFRLLSKKKEYAYTGKHRFTLMAAWGAGVLGAMYYRLRTRKR